MKLILELAIFFRLRVSSLFLQVLCDLVISKVREEYLAEQIEKYEKTLRRVRGLVELERSRRNSPE